MIAFEDRLSDIVGILPKITVDSTELQINFDWGTEEVLAKYLLLNGKMSFPLIWLVEGQDDNDLREPNVSRKARLVFLYESQAPDEFNTYQHKYYYDLILQPMLDNFITALYGAGVCRFDEKSIKTQRVKNYSMRKIEESLLFICNAIVVDIDLTMYGNASCINKNILFN